jgi:NADH-quinone oxidoreductase subunit N
LVFLLSGNYYKHDTSHLEDNYAILLFTLVGAVIMVSFSNMTMLFIGIEILSISLYVLAGSKKTDLKSNESALKYFLMGSFATGFLLFGIVLLYGATGSFHLQNIASYVNANSGHLPIIFNMGLLLIMIGLAFKLSIVPFHFWTPDVYEGAPTLITTFMATVVKTAGFAAFFRLFSTCFPGIHTLYAMPLSIMAVLSMSLGNITAVYQVSLKRTLAYSSIAHAGYMLLALLAMNQFAAGSILLYTAAYSLATIAAFALLMLVKSNGLSDNFESFNGLGRKNPFLGVVSVLTMLSLAGIPVTAGFFAKYYIFYAALSKGYTWLVIVAIINSAIGAYYYFKVIIAMYFKEAVSEQDFVIPLAYKAVLIICSLLILLLGIFPGVIINLLTSFGS